MFEFLGTEMETTKLNRIIEAGAKTALSNKKFIELEIKKWKKSQKRKDMIAAEKYYVGDHDILKRKREVIGADGQLEEVENLPNNKIIDNQYAKLVDQKVNYLLAKPLTFETDDKSYVEALKDIFNNRFLRTFKNTGESALNGGLAWLHPYYSEDGELRFKKFEPYEILPFWLDAEHTELDFAVRVYPVEGYEGEREVIIEKVEIYHKNGIDRYILQNDQLIPDIENPSSSHLIVVDPEETESNYNWARVPLIAFKYNNRETPLLNRVKCLQDGINIMLSDFENNMQEDARNTILVLQNYDGTNLGEFRRNLAQYGAVKVKTVDGVGGDLKTLEVKVNAENYKAILELFKKALIENGRGYDAKDDRMSNNPNQMNIQSMYSDIDLDANGMETEYQAAFEELIWFVSQHLANTGKGDFEGKDVKVIFNRDILINESDSIDNCKKSVGILSTETIISQHPWTSDVEAELKRLKDEKQEEMEEYKNAFPQQNTGQNNGGQLNGQE
jgi:SPP1 family phage portal protein